MNDARGIDALLSRAVSRRSLLTGALALCGVTRQRLSAAGVGNLQLQISPFTLGVASGDPTSDGVVIWTRLAPDPLNGGGMPPQPVEVSWQVASDDRLTKVVRRGRTMARPEWAHAVHVEVDGLEAGRWYWYQFRVGNDLSPVGRTRTLPPAGAPVDRLRFAFVSCQNYEQGYFTAFQHAAAEDLDLIFHLGDYIYELGASPRRPRQHLGPELVTLEHYRNRYAQYKTDPDLQAAHAAFPWFVTSDDHEVDNNYAAAISEENDPVEAFLNRRTVAYRAYYEHMPLRRASRPVRASMQLYRGFTFGSLAAFFILDTRQFRSDQPCGDNIKAPCAGTFDPKATMLGAQQERWLIGGLERSRARWNVLPQQVLMARVDRGPGAEERYSMDQWPGYEAERRRLLEFFSTGRAANPVILTGDVHTNWVNDLQIDGRDPKSPIVATEFVGTSITSGGDGTDRPGVTTELLAENPFVKFYNGQRGYVSCDMTQTSMRAQFQVVDYISRPGAPKKTRAVFVVEDGRPGAQQLEGQ